MLKLTRAQEQDRGLYSCLASNEAGEARRDFSVEVLGTSLPGSLGRPPILPSSLGASGSGPSTDRRERPSLVFASLAASSLRLP